MKVAGDQQLLFWRRRAREHPAAASRLGGAGVLDGEAAAMVAWLVHGWAAFSFKFSFPFLLQLLPVLIDLVVLDGARALDD